MPRQTGGPARYNPIQYPWLLTADPPVCRSGPALGVLQRCERLRRGDRCVCRFATGDIAEDLESAGRADLAEYFANTLEPEDVEELARELHLFNPGKLTDEDVASRLLQFMHDLDRLVDAGAGLTDRFSDDLE